MADRDSLPQDLRTDWHRYVDELVPLRPDLFRYCRRLTGSVWDAEDLVQDTLVRAFGQWGVTRPLIRNPKSYLLRTATNVWIDLQRRRQTERRDPEGVAAETAPRAESPATGSELREAGARLLQQLSPQERAALVLKEVFEMTLEEIAEILTTSVGAVKAALHRGRGRLAESADGSASRRPEAPPDVIDRFVDRFHAHDLEGLVALMLDTSAWENVGNSVHYGLEAEDGVRGPLDKVVHGHREWPKAFHMDGVERRAERMVFDGEPLVAFFVARDGKEALSNVMRFDVCDDRIARVRSYGFCPDTIRSIAESLGTLAWTGLYRAPTLRPGVDYPEP